MPTTADEIVDAWTNDDVDAGRALFDARLSESDDSFAELCNAVALRIAERFLDGELDFGAADWAASALWGRIVDDIIHEPIPEPAFAIYLAFDAGGYIRSEDGPSVDPVERYTLPQLNAILARD